MELIKFNNKNYDIEDIKTSKNLNRIQAEKIKHLETLSELRWNDLQRLNKVVEEYKNKLLNILENRKYWIKQ
mgnify:CR=1 FL=1|tara:strand:- start:1 stop:216 length:216 start_codon:yes stop_codon:yes gene_type:complete